MLNVPMLKDDDLVGQIAIYRQEVRPFTDKQIALVQNFAAQAVIAIENARLLNELREALEQQTASAGVLRIISSSPGELKPVFQAILANAVRICEAELANLFLHEENMFRAVEMYGASPAYAEAWRQAPVFSVCEHRTSHLHVWLKRNKSFTLPTSRQSRQAPSVTPGMSLFSSPLLLALCYSYRCSRTTI